MNGTGVTLTLSGSVTDTPITVTLGALNESSTGVIGGASTVTITAGTSTLGGANTYTGLTSVGATGILKVTNNLGLGSAAGATVISGSGGYVVLSNGVTVTGETITIFGAAANSDGPLQSDTGATAEWAGKRHSQWLLPHRRRRRRHAHRVRCHQRRECQRALQPRG